MRGSLIKNVQRRKKKNRIGGCGAQRHGYYYERGYAFIVRDVIPITTGSIWGGLTEGSMHQISMERERESSVGKSAGG